MYMVERMIFEHNKAEGKQMHLISVFSFLVIWSLFTYKLKIKF